MSLLYITPHLEEQPPQKENLTGSGAFDKSIPELTEKEKDHCCIPGFVYSTQMWWPL